MADEEDVAFTARRYSAVALTHPSLRSLEDVATRMGSLEAVSPIRGEAANIWRADWFHAKNLYPYGSALRRSTANAQRSDGQFKHSCFIAQMRPKAADALPVFVFASPHIKVVGHWSEHLADALDSPRAKYSVPRLDKLFNDLSSSVAAYKATQITLQIPSSVNVEKVSLTGKSPLISSLRTNLEGMTRPYAVRLELPRDGAPALRFHMDRHGNYWWFQANDRALATAIAGLSSLAVAGYLDTTHDLPYRRSESEDISEEVSDDVMLDG